MADTRLQVACLSYALPPDDGHCGGIERAADDLAQGLARRGHSVVMFSADSAPRGALYEVRRLPWSHWLRSFWGRRIGMGYLGNLIPFRLALTSFDVVATHGDGLFLSLCHPRAVRIFHGSA